MKKKGFTLIEVVASLIIVGVALVAILGMFSISSRTSKLSEERVAAYNLLQRKMEEVKAKDFASIASAPNESYSGFSDYTLNTTVTNPSTYLKEVEVKIQWAVPLGGTNEETITTKMTDQDRTTSTRKPGKGEKRGKSDREKKE